MKNGKNIIRMPYHETDDYIGQLVSKATEQAIRHKNPARRFANNRMAVAAAIVLLLTVSGITYYRYVYDENPLTAQSQSSPVDEFLNNLTEEEVMMLSYYEVEEITENEY